MVSVGLSVSLAALLPPTAHSRLNCISGARVRFPRPTFKCSALSTPLIVEEHKRFVEASEFGNLIPIHRRIFSDHLTPVVAYRCLVKEDDREVPSFLFESVEPGAQPTVGRYSVLGAQPALEIVAKENRVTVMDHEEGSLTEEIIDDPMLVPRRISDPWKPQLVDGLPDAFIGGWVGYFSYDSVRYVERKRLPFSRAPKDDSNLPDIHLGLYTDVIVFDHVEKKVHVVHWVRMDQHSSVEKAYNDGVQHLERLISRVQNNLPRLPPGLVDLITHHFGPSLKKSNMTSEAYKEAVLKAKEHILAGDIVQIVLSQRFERRTFADPFEVYRSLRVVNPSRYMSYLQSRGCILVGSNPEILTRVRKVAGELHDHLTCWDALRAALPAGTVSGAPKVKAMELIDYLEVNRRGPYGGGFGSISFTGDMDIAVALRTMVFPNSPRYDTMYSYRDSKKQRREWVAYLQAAAGIVADSDPDDENEECQNNAAGLARAIDLAESAFLNK